MGFLLEAANFIFEIFSDIWLFKWFKTRHKRNDIDKLN
jgi:hypothetical protein